MKGKRLPQVGRVEISIIEESNPQLLAFDSGELDYVNVPRDLVAQRARRRQQAEAGVREPGRRRCTASTQPALAYTYFNMDDPVVGGYTPDKIALRRAIIMGFNTDELIKVWWQGQAITATQPIPPGVSGHSAGFVARGAVRPGAARTAARQVRLQGPRQGRLSRAAGRQAVHPRDGVAHRRDATASATSCGRRT